MANRATLNSRKKKKLIFYCLMMLYPVVHFVIFYIVVNANSILLAFKEYDTLSGKESFIGFDNFKTVFYNLAHAPELKYALKNSLVAYLCVGILAQVFILIFAYYIYKKMFASTFYKLLIFLPSILSEIVVSILYFYFCDAALPEIIGKLTGQNVPGFMGDIDKQQGFILFYCIWGSFGTCLLMYTGGMSAISDSISESAQLDGCTSFQEFIHITIPQIFPTITTFLVVNMVSVFTNQMSLISFYNVDAEQKVYTYGYYLFRRTAMATQSGYPYLSAMGLVFTAIIVPVTLGLRKLLEKYGPKEE